MPSTPAAERDYNASMSAIERITVNPEVCGGRPRIRGLRIRVADYPYLEADDITAVLEVAAKQNDHPVLRSA